MFSRIAFTVITDAELWFAGLVRAQGLLVKNTNNGRIPHACGPPFESVILNEGGAQAVRNEGSRSNEVHNLGFGNTAMKWRGNWITGLIRKFD
jgi:hypothetical protein